MTRYREISSFATAFAHEYRGFMRAHGVTNLQVAAVLGRNDGYVSERASGRRPLDTDDVDALASLVEGWSGRGLMIELARRTRADLSESSGTVVDVDFGADDAEGDDMLAAASDSADTRPDDRSDEGWL